MAKGYKLTKKQILKEVYKCGKDPLYFINNYVRISHPIRGLIPFKMFDYQEQLVKDFNDHRFNIILKARQLGISTNIAAYAAWMLLFHRNKEILVVATKFDTAANLTRKVKTMIKYTPDWIKIASIDTDNRTSFELSNGSQIKASATSEDAGRSEALSLLIVDEAAFVPGIDNMWKAIKPTLSTGGRCFMASCVVEDTHVVTNLGIKRVGELVDYENQGAYKTKDYFVLGRDKVRQGNILYNNGKVKTRKIITKNAYLEGSYNHKLWSYSEEDGKYGWHRLDELKVGDYVAIQYGMDVWGNNDDVSSFDPKISRKHKNIFKPSKITKDIAYILGLYLSEGSVYKKIKNSNFIAGTTTFSCGDGLTEVLEKNGLKVSKSDKFHHCCSSKTFIEFLEYLGFDVSKKAPQKIIPSRVLEMSRENIIALLQGIWDGDGYSRSDRGEVGIGLTSLKMIEQLRMILNNFGILSDFRKYETRPTKKVKVWSTSWRLTLNKEESIKFYDIVGFRFQRKQKNKKVVESSNLKRSNAKDIIPNSLHHMRNMFEIYSKGTGELIKKYGFHINGVVNKKRQYKTKNISRKNVIKMFDIVKKQLPDWYRCELERIVSKNIKWVPIKEILENEAETFDFSLPDNNEDFWAHSVIYNGILGHQTPSGVGNFFHKTYIDAKEGKNDFHPTKLMWYEHPDRDQDWYDKETKSMSRRDIAQELCCDFLSSGETVFDPEDLKRMEAVVKEPLYKTGFDRNLWIWEEYNPEASYLLVADVARGDGQDYSAFHIMKLQTMEIVAEYQGKVTPDFFANLINQFGREYGRCLVVVENATVGFAVLDKLSDLEYPNIYYSVKSTHEYIEQYEAESRSGTVAGFTTSLKTRPLIIAKMEEFVRNKLIITYSTRLVNEMRTFVWENGKPTAMKNYNDDLIMACAIGCWVRDTALTENLRDLEYKRAFIGAIKKTGTRLDTTIPGMSKCPISPGQEEAKKQYKEFGWVLGITKG